MYHNDTSWRNCNVFYFLWSGIDLSSINFKRCFILITSFDIWNFVIWDAKYRLRTTFRRLQRKYGASNNYNNDFGIVLRKTTNRVICGTYKRIYTSLLLIKTEETSNIVTASVDEVPSRSWLLKSMSRTSDRFVTNLGVSPNLSPTKKLKAVTSVAQPRSLFILYSLLYR